MTRLDPDLVGGGEWGEGSECVVGGCPSGYSAPRLPVAHQW